MLTFTLEKEAMLIKLHVPKLGYINIFPLLYKIFLCNNSKIEVPF